MVHRAYGDLMADLRDDVVEALKPLRKSAFFLVCTTEEDGENFIQKYRFSSGINFIVDVVEDYINLSVWDNGNLKEFSTFLTPAKVFKRCLEWLGKE